MQKSGSVGYSIDNAFVPEAFACTGMTPRRGGILPGLGIFGLSSLCYGALAVGNARRALEELNAYLSGKPDRATDYLKVEAAKTHAALEAASAFGRRVCEEIDQSVAREEPLPTRVETNLRLAVRHTTFVAAEAAEFAYRSSGTSALRDSRIQQCFRDANAMTQHQIVSEPIARACGEQLLGLAPDQIWVAEATLAPAAASPAAA